MRAGSSFISVSCGLSWSSCAASTEGVGRTRVSCGHHKEPASVFDRFNEVHVPAILHALWFVFAVRLLDLRRTSRVRAQDSSAFLVESRDHVTKKLPVLVQYVQGFFNSSRTAVQDSPYTPYTPPSRLAEPGRTSRAGRG